MPIKKAYGLLVIQAQKSNPNGDPDRDGAPRVDTYGHGVISPAATKRRVRDAIARKAEAFKDAAEALGIQETDYPRFQIYVERDQPAEKVLEEAKNMDAFHRKYWDARVFGNTLLESSAGAKREHRASLRCGVITLYSGRTLAPVQLAAQTWTRVSSVQAGKSSGMAPEGHKYLEYGLYTQPFAINPERAERTGVTDQDCELFVRLAPHIYDGRSVASAGCEVLQCWTLTFHKASSTLPIQTFFDAVRPRIKTAKPTGFDDYELVTEAIVDPRLASFGEVRQWVESLPATA